MAVSRAERRDERRERVVALFGEACADAALDLLELTELAWHDCHGEISPSEDVVEDILICSRSDLAGLIRAARLAVTDWRDLKSWADIERSKGAS